MLFPGKSLVHFHGLAVRELPLYRYFSSRLHRAHYVFCARHIRQTFKERYPSIPEDHLHVVYNGIDVRKFGPAQSRNSNGRTKICFYCGWHPYKGIYEVLDAARILESQRDDFEIHFGGSAFSHYMQSLSRSKELDSRVRGRAADLKSVKFVGDILYDDLPGFLNQMDIGLAPSIHADPFPLVPLEMMACGLPVVAYDIGGARESVVDGETGYLVENKNTHRLAEAIERLLDNPTLRTEMGRTARRRVEQHFTWEKHVEELVKIYKLMQG